MNKNKGFIGMGLLIAIILGIVVVAGGAYYLGKNNEKNKNKEVVKTGDRLLEYKTPCDISTISKKSFSFSYPEGYTIKEIKPLEGDVPLSGVMQITIQPKDGSEPIIIGPGFDVCEGNGIKLCKNIGDIYRLSTNNNSESSTYAYNKILSTIKSGPGCLSSKVNSSEESTTETFKNQPGEIKGIKDIGRGQYEITVDLLTLNPKWIPGGNEKFFSNQSSKIRSLHMDLSAKTYNCGEGADGNPTTADVPENNSIFINKIINSNYKNRYFDIDGANITAIYEQCLP